MGKLASKQVALAKQILETEDEAVLRSVDELLNGGVRFSFTADEIAEFQARLASYSSGSSEGADWATVKRRVKARLRA